ncbi:hypothetical protein [Microbulbifer magnicolonia]|uniref:hypothetical protein n=1 Tax=Microbulbifer magnicolonia TaxID=3109744 RepID=UPI002B417D96|nr:hypothetical protein [Microbulbifer sp. GG15]
MKKGLLAVPLVVLAACSNQQIYDSVQRNRLHNCEKYSGPQYRDCLQQYDQSYADYQRQRRELLREEE